MLTENTLAPDFAVQADDGSVITRASLLGRPAVIYFYPKNNTPGCTKEACEFRDVFPRFGAVGVTILGVSTDSVASHIKFKRKYELPFTLLADEDHRMAEAFGVWKARMFFGNSFLGMQRATFVLDRNGTIVKVFPKVRVAGHAAEVQKVLELLR